MSERTEPCKFAVKNSLKGTNEVVEVVDGHEVRKIKKVVQKKDSNGAPLFEVKEVTVKKGCGCKGKKQEEKVIKKRVPVTEEIWVEETIPTKSTKIIKSSAENDKTIICKLYGRVKQSYCQKCSTYKVAKRR